jgi:hypothetical protein
MNFEDLKTGDLLQCEETINNIANNPMFIKKHVYQVLYLNKEQQLVILNHILYSNEYAEHTFNFINKYFKRITNEKEEKQG